MSQYTKGEWKAHEELIETDYSPNGAVIAVANKATEKWEANAQLISAAPTMYEALKAVKNCGLSSFLRPLREQIQQALAKANGK